MEQEMRVKWIDGKREPKCAPNPAYPNGIDLDGTMPGEKSCLTKLPYPAKRCGHFVVDCPVCGSRVVITTAGRPDDPRSVKVACKLATQAVN